MIKATLSFHIWSLSMHPVDWQVQSLLILLSLGSWQVLGQVDLKCFFVIILSLPKPRNDSYIVKFLLMLFYARPFLLLTASSLVCGISINADISTSSKTFFHVFSSLVLPLKRKFFGKLISWTFKRNNLSIIKNVSKIECYYHLTWRIHWQHSNRWGRCKVTLIFPFIQGFSGNWNVVFPFGCFKTFLKC